MNETVEGEGEGKREGEKVACIEKSPCRKH
jgi:hypothetical protein